MEIKQPQYVNGNMPKYNAEKIIFPKLIKNTHTIKIFCLCDTIYCSNIVC